MEDRIKELSQQIEEFKIEGKETLEKFRIQFLGSKNVLKDLFAEIRNVAADKRKEVGQSINSLKTQAQDKFNRLSNSSDEAEEQKSEIEAQRDFALSQHKLISQQKKTISDSINYAREIQQAVLPDEDILKKYGNLDLQGSLKTLRTQDLQDAEK